MEDPSQKPSINGWLEDEMLQQYRHDRQNVDSSWSPVFEGNGHTVPAPKSSSAVAVAEPPTVAVAEGDQLIPLRGPALRIAENMAASLTIPVATSQRAMPVKVIDENRRVINQYRAAAGLSKLSYTHLVAWAIVKALEQVPALNQAYSERGDESFRAALEARHGPRGERRRPFRTRTGR